MNEELKKLQEKIKNKPVVSFQEALKILKEKLEQKKDNGAE